MTIHTPKLIRHGRRSLLLPCGGLLLVLAACSDKESAIKPADENRPPGVAGAAGTGNLPGGGAPGAGSTGGSGGKAIVDCDQERRGPKMVRIDRVQHGDAYCIDATETTQLEYSLFLMAVGKAPSVYDTHPYCKTNNANGYQPQLSKPTDNATTLPCGLPSSWNPAETPQRVATCLDWCDASAYCAWAGKRLCGMRDGVTEKPELGKFTLPVESSEWGYACAEGEPAKAATYIPPKECTAATVGGGPTLRQVSTDSGCKGSKPPYDAVFDLGSNAREWQGDGCAPSDNPDAPPLCLMRGTVPWEQRPPDAGSCVAAGWSSMVRGASDLGFRCCAD